MTGRQLTKNQFDYGPYSASLAHWEEVHVVESLARLSGALAERIEAFGVLNEDLSVYRIVCSERR